MSAVRLPRRTRAHQLVSLAPLVDVLLILLVFFMVTSTYLDLDMIPMAEPGEAPVQTTAATNTESGRSGAVLIRLDAEGRSFLAGERLEGQALSDAVARRLAGTGDGQVLVLPSSRAPAQALVDVLGAVAFVGAGRVQVVRFEAIEASRQ